MRKLFRDEKEFALLREALGPEFADTVIRFFCNVMLSDFDYVVVMSRRCFVLYRIFFRLLRPMNSGGKMPEIVTDKAIARLLTEGGLEGKSCLILDDILIHGRTVAGVYDRLKDSFEQVRVYVCAASLDCYQSLLGQVREELAEITFSEENVSSSGWKRLSERLIRVIRSFREPYTSFLLSFFTGYWPEGQPPRESARWEIYQEDDGGERLEVLFEDQAPAFFSRYCDQVCLRVVRWDGGGVCITPTAFLKPVRSSELPGFLRALCADLPEGFSEVLKWLSMDSGLPELGRFQYRLATTLVSAVYGSYALSRLGLDPGGLAADLQTLECSFSPRIARCIGRQLRAPAGWLDSVPAAPEWDGFREFAESGELEEDFCQCMAPGDMYEPDVRRGLLKYFFLNGVKDERSILTQSSTARDIGLSTPHIAQLARESGIGEKRLYAGLVAVWDTGRGSMDVCENGSYFAAFNCAGERSYRTVNEYLGQHIRNLRRLEDLLLCGDIQAGGEMASQERFDSRLREVMREYCACAGERFGWSSQVLALALCFIDFVIESRVSVGDYDLDPRTGKGDPEIADFGKQFIKEKRSLLTAV